MTQRDLSRSLPSRREDIRYTRRRCIVVVLVHASHVANASAALSAPDHVTLLTCLLAGNRQPRRASIIWSRRRGLQRLRRASPAPGDHFLSIHPPRSTMGSRDIFTGQRGAAYERNRLARRRFDCTICALVCRIRVFRGGNGGSGTCPPDMRAGNRCDIRSA